MKPDIANGADGTNAWAEKWLQSVAGGKSVMSQRKLSAINARGGGISQVRRLAQELGVHLLIVEDDKGNELVAASTRPFKVVC